MCTSLVDQSLKLTSLVFVVRYILYIADMVSVGRGIHGRGPDVVIPATYGASMQVNRFVGAMGIIGIFAYGVSLVAAITFFLLAILAYQSRKPHKQNTGLYKVHLSVFSALLFLAGLSQFLLGCFLAARFGRLHQGAVYAGFYVVARSGIAIFVGAIQLIGGLWGMMTSMWRDKSHLFQYYMLTIWLCQVVLQALTQASYPPFGLLAGLAPTVMAFTIPLNLMPAYLHYKANNVPDNLSADYYGIHSSDHGDTEAGEPHEHITHHEQDDPRDVHYGDPSPVLVRTDPGAPHTGTGTGIGSRGTGGMGTGEGGV
jgi:hypothetical protein